MVSRLDFGIKHREGSDDHICSFIYLSTLFHVDYNSIVKANQIEYKRSYTHKANETAPPPRTVRSYLRAD